MSYINGNILTDHKAFGILARPNPFIANVVIKELCCVCSLNLYTQRYFLYFPKPINNAVILFHKWNTFCELLLLKCSWCTCSWFVFMGFSSCEANSIIFSPILTGNMESKIWVLVCSQWRLQSCWSLFASWLPKGSFSCLEIIISTDKYIKT